MSRLRELGGRPEYLPSEAERHLVSVLAGMGVPDMTIAKRLTQSGGIDHRTLRKHFADELAHGKEHLLANLKVQIVQAAQKGSVRAQTWLLERLDPVNFGQRMRIAPDEMPLLASNAETKVEIYLPDNARGASDVSTVSVLTPPPVIDAEVSDISEKTSAIDSAK